MLYLLSYTHHSDQARPPHACGWPHRARGAPEGIRTHDLRLRRPLLYPPELLARIGTAGFEPATPCAQDRCATKLRYAPSVLSH